MNLEAGLFSVLKSASAVAALVSNPTSPTTYRIFPGRIPQGETRPSIRYDRISTVRPQGLDGPSAFLTSRFQIDVWGETEAAARALGDAVVAAIDGNRGSFGPATIQHGYVEDVGALPEFDPDERDYRITMDYVIVASD